MINFAVLNGVLLVASFLFAFRFFEEVRKSFLAMAVYTFFFFIVLLIGVQILVGMFGALDVWAVSGGSYVLGLLSVLFFGKYFWRNFQFRRPKLNTLLVVVLGVLAVFGIVEAFNALIQPVWEYDSISYHLPIARFWAVGGDLWRVFFSAYAGPLGYYPGNGELLTLWTILPVGADVLANIQNIFLMFVFAVTGAYLLIRLGVGKVLSWVFPLLFLTSPIILKEVGNAHVDLLFALTFLYVILFVYEYVKTKGANFATKYIIPVFLAFGLFLGTKYLAVPYAFLPLVIFVFYFVKNFKRGVRLKMLRCLGFGIVGFVLVGGFWYLRNLIIAGNPVFPAEVKVGSLVLFDGFSGLTDKIMEWSLWNNLASLDFAELKNMALRYVFRTGFQTLVIGFSYVVLVVMVVVRALKKSFNKIDLLFLFSIPFFFYLYLISPYTYNDFDANIRYSVLTLLTGGSLVVYLMNRVGVAGVLRWFLGVLIAGSVVGTLWVTLGYSDLPHEIFNLSFVDEYIWLFTVFVLKIVLIGVFAFVVFGFKSVQKVGILLSLALIPLVLFLGNSGISEVRENEKFDVLRHKYPPNFESLINGFEWVEREVPDGSKIAYSGFHFHYPLYGAYFQRDAMYVNINNCRDCDYYDYRDSGNGIMTDADINWWFSNLDGLSIDYVMLYDQVGFMKFEPSWVQIMSDKFEKVFEDGGVAIYKFLN
ncbi:MAG: hypothetical protein WC604_03435 [Candidatus Gracilibacteria bacterium]